VGGGGGNTIRNLMLDFPVQVKVYRSS